MRQFVGWLSSPVGQVIRVIVGGGDRVSPARRSEPAAVELALTAGSAP
jgi:hypothetical protein